MPSHYAHYYFGNEVIRVMPSDVKDIINQNSACIDAYRLGLQGPDFLAFYRPGIHNSLQKEGRRIHQSSGRDFFHHAAQILKDRPNPESYSYIFGCINHFILDSACHPVVSEYMITTGLSHSKIEREFDNYILRICGKSPRRINLAKIFPHNDHLDELISNFYQNLKPSRTKEAIDSMTRILTLFTRPNSSTRNKLSKAFRILPIKSLNKARDMIYFEKPAPEAALSSAKLFDALNKSVMLASMEMDAFMNYLLLDTPLDETFDMNFLGVVPDSSTSADAK